MSSQIPKDARYNPSCTKFESCSEGESIAAVYDYVGAVYGDKGRVQRDGILTPEERSYVESTFGRLEGKKGVQEYLSKARQIFFKKYAQKEMPYCEGDKSSLVRYKHPRFREGVTLGAGHTCGDNYGEMYVKSGLELQIASNPKKVVFLVEGWTQAVGRSRLQEHLLIARIALALKIPVYEGLVGQNSEEAIQRVGLTRMEAAVATAMILYEDMVETAKKQNLTFDPVNMLAQKIQDTALFYGLDAMALVAEFNKLNAILPGEDMRSALIRVRGICQERFSKLLRATNELSPDHARGVLAKTKADLAVFILGLDHLSYVRKVYEKGRP